MEVDFMFYGEDLKDEQDYIDLLIEIEAYQNIDGEDFDFGNGLITNEMSYGSEDAYYEMDIQTLEDIIEYWESDNSVIKTRKKPKTHRKYLQKKQDNRLKKILHPSPSLVTQKDGWIERCYQRHQTFHPKKVSKQKSSQVSKRIPTKRKFPSQNLFFR